MKYKVTRWVRYPIYPHMPRTYMPDDPTPVNPETEDDLH